MSLAGHCETTKKSVLAQNEAVPSSLLCLFLPRWVLALCLHNQNVKRTGKISPHSTVYRIICLPVFYQSSLPQSLRSIWNRKWDSSKKSPKAEYTVNLSSSTDLHCKLSKLFFSLKADLDIHYIRPKIPTEPIHSDTT